MIAYGMNLEKLRVVVFWIMMPLMNWYHHFGGTYCLHLQDRKVCYKGAEVSFNHWYRFYGTSYWNPVEQRSQILCSGTRVHNFFLRFRCHFAVVLTAALIVPSL